MTVTLTGGTKTSKLAKLCLAVSFHIMNEEIVGSERLGAAVKWDFMLQL